MAICRAAIAITETMAAALLIRSKAGMWWSGRAMCLVYALCPVDLLRTPRRCAFAAAFIYCALIAVMGRQVVRAPGGGVVHDASDSVLSAAILAWNASHVPLTDGWWQFPIFAPTADAIAFSEVLLGVSVISGPLQWLTGSPLAAYNLTVLFAYPACALAMYALVYRLTRHSGAAFLAGLAFGFAPYRAGQLGHIQLLAVFWAPLSLMALHSHLDGGRRRWLICAGACWLLQGMANMYMLVYLSTLLAMWTAWFVVGQRRWRTLGAIVATFAVFAIPLLPIVVRFSAAHARNGLARMPGEAALYSADLAAPLCASPNLVLWSRLRIGCGAEGELFIGFTLLALCVLGAATVLRRRGAITGFYMLAALVTWTLTWGPQPTFAGSAVLSAGPFAWLMAVPGVDGLRVPARFWMVTVLCLSAAMGIMLADMLLRRSRRSAWTIVAVAACGLIADGWSVIELAAAPAVFASTRPLDGATVMELPVGDIGRDTAAEFRAVNGGWRVVNGYSGYEPAHYPAMRAASRDEDPALFTAFLDRSDLEVLVPDDAPRLRELVERLDAAVLQRTSGFTHYRLRRRPAPAPAARGQRRLPVALSASCEPERLGQAMDGDRRTRWHCGPQDSDQEVTIDLGMQARTGAVVLALGAFTTDFPRRLIVETSADGSNWAAAWNGPVLGETIAAGLADPRRVPVMIPFAPREARFVRLRQVGRDPTWYWSIAELEVWSG
jgi:hypothetical protein